MNETPQIAQSIPISRIFLGLDNPRFEPVASEGEAISVLCATENVYPLAADIVKQGSLNPLDKIALLPLKSGGKRETYTVAEGNRRICALKLLIDPELAPLKLRAKFEALSEKWTPVDSVSAVIFHDHESVQVWLQRMHEGQLGGVGRKTWDATQVQRFSGTGKNKLALELLDYCEEQGMISKDERKGKLTTVQRFVTKDVFAEHFGLDKSDPTTLRRNLSKKDFDQAIAVFIKDLIKGDEVSSRMNKPDISDYARDTVKRLGINTERIAPEPLTSDASNEPAKKRNRKKKTKAPEKPKYLTHSAEIVDGLEKLANWKLKSLYHSLINIELEDNTPLISVGAWCFLECLTACDGRPENNDFTAHLSKHKLTQLGITETNDKKAISSALKRIQSYGNVTKHHSTSASFNGEQLNNDMDILREVIVKSIKSIQQKML